jgi:hypothetical protein
MKICCKSYPQYLLVLYRCKNCNSLKEWATYKSSYLHKLSMPLWFQWLYCIYYTGVPLLDRNAFNVHKYKFYSRQWMF